MRTRMGAGGSKSLDQLASEDYNRMFAFSDTMKSFDSQKLRVAYLTGEDRLRRAAMAARKRNPRDPRTDMLYRQGMQRLRAAWKAAIARLVSRRAEWKRRQNAKLEAENRKR